MGAPPLLLLQCPLVDGYGIASAQVLQGDGIHYRREQFIACVEACYWAVVRRVILCTLFGDQDSASTA
ncbi:unnamed protein product [Anisakis simplex]|uniref:Secreted protein n=1 Tax=Anisakis simplex TaxID=6269 RepID=A0A0M3KHV8_ANISI|nr:unnamed protein product [Anisakis simplex]